MFHRTQAYYDAIYSIKDYAKESRKVHSVILRHNRSKGHALLDTACGTGLHMAHLRRHYEVEGLDVDEGMLRVARRRLKGVPLHLGDMRSFRLGREFDAVLCLFSSIGYTKTTAGLDRALAAFARHTKPGGVVIVEPWLTPEAFIDGHTAIQTFDGPQLKIARAARTSRRGRLSTLRFRYLIVTPRGIRTVDECHELALFTLAEYRRAFRRAGLRLHYDKRGLTGRGLFIGTKPL